MTGQNTTIQQLRGAAILLVLFQHFSLSSSAMAAIGLTNPGFVGVELFFVISGYVVMQTLRRHDWSVTYFVGRRLFRLYPPLALFLLMAGITFAWANSYPEGHIARAIFGGSPANFWAQSIEVLTGTYSGTNGNSYVFGAVWSLTVEFQFYFLVTALLAIAAALRIGAARTQAAIQVGAAAGLVILLACRGLVLAGGDVAGFLGMMLSWKADFLLGGVLLALAMPASALRTSRPGWLILVAVAAALVIIALGPAPPLTAMRVRMLDGFSMPALLALFAATVAIAAGHPAGLGMAGSRGARLLGRAFVWVGDRSYTIYLLHFPVMALVWLALFGIDPALVSSPVLYGVLQAAIALPISLLVAQGGYRLIEVPAIALGARLLAKHWPGRAPAAVLQPQAAARPAQ